MNLPISIDKRSGIPIYLQIEERVRLLVREGALAPGDDMPTVRALAVHLGINANTVARVYRDLQTDGVLRLERGVGTFVADTSKAPIGQRDLHQLEKKVVDLIRLARKTGLNPAELAQFIETRWKEVNDVPG